MISDLYCVLQRVVLQDNFDSASTIIQDMTDINQQDNNGRTALHTAVQYSSQNMVNLLLNHGADSKIVDNVSDLSDIYIIDGIEQVRYIM